MAILLSSLLTASLETPRNPPTRSITEAKSWGGKSVFLCHSHKDKAYVLGLINVFAEQGWRVYVDWQDGAMPETPNDETANRIQSRIRQLDLFLFLATPNSMSSRWCPWEIGYADAAKGRERVVVVPTTDATNVYGSEYLGLYKRIDVASGGGLEAFMPGNRFYSTPLRSL